MLSSKEMNEFVIVNKLYSNFDNWQECFKVVENALADNEVVLFTFVPDSIFLEGIKLFNGVSVAAITTHRIICAKSGVNGNGYIKSFKLEIEHKIYKKICDDIGLVIETVQGKLYFKITNINALEYIYNHILEDLDSFKEKTDAEMSDIIESKNDTCKPTADDMSAYTLKHNLCYNGLPHIDEFTVIMNYLHEDEKILIGLVCSEAVYSDERSNRLFALGSDTVIALTTKNMIFVQKNRERYVMRIIDLPNDIEIITSNSKIIIRIADKQLFLVFEGLQIQKIIIQLNGAVANFHKTYSGTDVKPLNLNTAKDMLRYALLNDLSYDSNSFFDEFKLVESQLSDDEEVLLPLGIYKFQQNDYSKWRWCAAAFTNKKLIVAGDGHSAVFYLDNLIAIKKYKNYLLIETENKEFTFEVADSYSDKIYSYILSIVDLYKNPNKRQSIMSSPTDQILKYKNLLDMGAITLEEYEQKKKQLLNL